MISQDNKNKLIEEAKKTLENPYAIQNNGNYSAAVLTDQNNIYSGISYSSDTHSLTLRGEQAALSHAASHGEANIVAMAITSNEDKKHGEFTNPCHMCKQLMYESQRRSNIPMHIILVNNHDETKEIELDDIISYPWPE